MNNGYMNNVDSWSMSKKHSYINYLYLYSGVKSFGLTPVLQIMDERRHKLLKILTDWVIFIKDFIDMLKSDCLFKEEYTELFKSLIYIELPILSKFIFNEEYIMKKLKLKVKRCYS